MTTSILFHQCPLCVFKIEPHPVSGLRVVFVGVTHVALTWKNDNITDTCRMFLEGSQESTQNLALNISDLKPGVQKNVTLYLLNKSQSDPLVTENSLGELQKWASDLPWWF